MFMKTKRINNFYWVARDTDGTLCAFISKPYNSHGYWFSSQLNNGFYLIPRLYEDIFKDLTYDESPKLIVVHKS